MSEHTFDIRLLDRCERWCDAERTRLEDEVRAGGTWPAAHALPSFNTWPEGAPHYLVHFAWRSTAALDDRFWKHGNAIEAGHRLSQLEIALRYGPLAIPDCEANDLAEWIETDCQPSDCIYKDELEQWLNAEGGLFQSLREQSWEDPFVGDAGAVVDELARRGLDGLLWLGLDWADWADEISHRQVATIVMFAAQHGVYLLDDTGWLISGWRERAILALGKALNALPEGALERHPWLAVAQAQEDRS